MTTTKYTGTQYNYNKSSCRGGLTCILIYQKQNGAGETPAWITTLAVPPENQSLSPSTHLLAHDCL